MTPSDSPSCGLHRNGTPAASLLAAESLGVRYGNFWALRQVSFGLSDGDAIGIIGPNGGGKSTLLKTLLGQIAPNEGEVRVSPEKPRIGYVPQKLAFDLSFPITVGEFLSVCLPETSFWFGGINRKYRKKIEETLEKAGAKNTLHQTLGSLSGGQLQRVLIASALLRTPKILFLDEPSASIDRKGTEELLQLLKELHSSEKVALLFVSHDLHFVSRLANRVLCLNQTCCALGSPEEILTPHHLGNTFGPNDIRFSFPPPALASYDS